MTGNNAGNCVLGCASAEDRIEHYEMCPVMWLFLVHLGPMIWGSISVSAVSPDSSPLTAAWQIAIQHAWLPQFTPWPEQYTCADTGLAPRQPICSGCTLSAELADIRFF